MRKSCCWNSFSVFNESHFIIFAFPLSWLFDHFLLPTILSLLKCPSPPDFTCLFAPAAPIRSPSPFVPPRSLAATAMEGAAPPPPAWLLISAKTVLGPPTPPPPVPGVSKKFSMLLDSSLERCFPPKGITHQYCYIVFKSCLVIFGVGRLPTPLSHSIYF